MNYEEAKKLLSKGVWKGDLDLVKEGLKIVKDVNIKYNHGMAPLYVASFYGKLEIVKYLITLCADVSVNSKNEFGNTPLHIASREGHLEVVKYLISNGANINIKNENGKRPLHVASYNGHLEIVKYLISVGADVNSKDNDENTPLHLASKYKNLKIVKYLITLGADLNLENKETISKIKKLLEQIKYKIYRMYIFTQILNQKYLDVSIFLISKILKSLFDHKNLFSNEEIITISDFSIENRSKVLLETEEQKYQHLYYPLYEKYPHLFGYLQI